MDETKPLVGFIGQGWIGKNYADNFEFRGFQTVRYALETPYCDNREKIKDCAIVFIAVPTPTTTAGFDASIVEVAISLVGKGKIAVIKSTILPGTAKKLQQKYPGVIVLFSPEFLSGATAAHDSANPFSNIVGLTIADDQHRTAAAQVQKILPPAPFVLICDSTEAEIIKYSHNLNGYAQIVFFNLFYDLARRLNADWEVIQQALEADPYVSSYYARPVHKNGRGAGGNCFLKDFAAFKDFYRQTAGDELGQKIFSAIETKNLSLLAASGKDQKIVEAVYGHN